MEDGLVVEERGDGGGSFDGDEEDDAEEEGKKDEDREKEEPRGKDRYPTMGSTMDRYLSRCGWYPTIVSGGKRYYYVGKEEADRLQEPVAQKRKG